MFKLILAIIFALTGITLCLCNNYIGGIGWLVALQLIPEGAGGLSE